MTKSRSPRIWFQVWRGCLGKRPVHRCATKHVHSLEYGCHLGSCSLLLAAATGGGGAMWPAAMGSKPLLSQLQLLGLI